MNIFISSACIKGDKIVDKLDFLIGNGVRKIELSSGNQYEKNIIKILNEYKHKYDLNFFIHNYFPDPINNFVLNLASLDDEIYDLSLNHCLNAINISKKLGVKKYAFHAGFFTDFGIIKKGSLINYSKIYDKDKSTNRFIEAWKTLKNVASEDLEIYIENNVLSLKNYFHYNKVKPFMLLNYKDYKDLKQKIDFKLLLDVAHLSVTCNSLNLNFKEELDYLYDETDYIHFSENNKYEDSNKGISFSDYIFNHIKYKNNTSKYITLEIYEPFTEIKKNLSSLLYN